MMVQLFPIYGVMLGFNYWNTSLDQFEEEDNAETEHLFQIMFFIIGISCHFWTQKKA
jgi:nitrogen fixation-related uncharacterized protein